MTLTLNPQGALDGLMLNVALIIIAYLLFAIYLQLKKNSHSNSKK